MDAELVKSLKRLEITTGLNNPYKQFSYSIAAGEIISIYYNFNYFRVLSVSASSGVSIRFGASGSPTDIVGAGIGYELPSVVDRAEIRNSSAVSIDIVIGVCIGRIDDDRLTVSGAISVATQSVLTSTADVTVAVATTTLIKAQNTSRKRILLSNISCADLRVGDSAITATRGHPLPLAGSMILENTAAVYGYSAAGGTVSVLEEA